MVRFFRGRGADLFAGGRRAGALSGVFRCGACRKLGGDRTLHWRWWREEKGSLMVVLTSSRGI